MEIKNVQSVLTFLAVMKKFHGNNMATPRYRKMPSTMWNLKAQTHSLYTSA
jgi:hypothetical protein